MKYIVVKFEEKELIFTFPRTIAHDRMYEAVGAIRVGQERNWERRFREAEVVAAGFVDGGICYGESETLKIKSRGQLDTRLLRTGEWA